MRIFEESLSESLLLDNWWVWAVIKGYFNDDIRFGQYICNKYLYLGKSAPEIFYEKDDNVAYHKIVDVLINQEI